MIKRESIDEVLEAADIVDVVQRYLPLKRSGSAWMGKCPFHEERTPSFSVNPRGQYFHCFSCNRGGDAIKFLQEIENLSFSDAVHKLCDFYRVEVKYDGKKAEPRPSNEALQVLQLHYAYSLGKNQEALEYLHKRGLSSKDIERFGLGFAPSSNESMRVLANAGISKEEALKAGALKAGEDGNLYASFIQRITFPIYDEKDSLIGFGGRTLKPDIAAKYVNSPACELFDKSKVFYLANLAKKAIYAKKKAIICEGYMDAIAFHQAGLNYAMAVLGTALGPFHVRGLRRSEAVCYLCFDSDKAGQAAAFRSGALLLESQITGYVVSMKEKDPSDIYLKEGANALEKILEDKEEIGSFCVKYLLAQHEIQEPTQKIKALDALRKFLLPLEPELALIYENQGRKLLGLSPAISSNLVKSPRPVSKEEIKPSLWRGSDLEELRVLKSISQAKNKDLYLQAISSCLSEDCFRHKEILRDLKAGKNVNESTPLRKLHYLEYEANMSFFDILLAILSLAMHKEEAGKRSLYKHLLDCISDEVIEYKESDLFQMLITLRKASSKEDLDLIWAKLETKERLHPALSKLVALSLEDLGPRSNEKPLAAGALAQGETPQNEAANGKTAEGEAAKDLSSKHLKMQRFALFRMEFE